MTAPAAAVSWSRIPPHRRLHAICETRKLLDFLNVKWDEANDYPDVDDRFSNYPGFFIYSDRLGLAADFSRAAMPYEGKKADATDFIVSMRTSEGKHDTAPVTAVRLVLLQADKYRPVYLLTLRRTKWEVYQTLPDLTEVQRYETSDSIWMMQFAGNEIYTLRQADELAPTAARGADLLGRDVDCAALVRKSER